MPQKLKPRKKYLLSARFCTPSAILLRDAIAKLSGERFLITTKDLYAPEAVARYGGNSRTTKIDTDMNSIPRINLLSNKLRLSELLLRNQVDTVQFFNTNPSNAVFPVIVRETLTSYGGRGIHVCRNMEEFTASWNITYHWTPFIQFSNEYRVHIAGGKVLRVFEKVREEGEETEEYPIRNSDRGYHFSIRNKPVHGVSIRTLVDNVAKIPELSAGFYALDVGWNRASKRLYVIEGNSAPGLNEETAKCYARYILGMEVNDEVLRANTDNTGTEQPNPVASSGQQHEHPVVRAQWVW